MAGRTYTIGEVAKTLGLDGKNNSTVRLWTETFADWLSPLTRPIKGQLRLYTEDDVKSLALVRDLRRQHMPYEEVRSRLQARGVALSEKAVGGTVEVSPAEVKPGAAVEAEELRELLSPVFEVSEALRRFLRESDYSVGIHLEIGRLASSVESLGAKLDHLRYDLEILRGELKTPVSPMAKGVAEGTGDARAFGGEVAGLVNYDRSVGSDRSGRSVISVGVGPSPEPSEVALAPGAGSGAEEGLNQYGLRPLPAWLAEHSLGAFSLCRRCGSTTKPLGVTPTARVVLLCIQCQERLTVPLAQIEAELGIRRSFWARLWQLLRHPFSRRR